MRMWMVPPKVLCRKHLLGEHVELHMLVGAINKEKRLNGFLEKQLIFPEWIISRHEEIAREIVIRGYNHDSPLQEITKFGYFSYLIHNTPTYTLEDVMNRNLEVLWDRCEECKKRIFRGKVK